MIDFHRHYRALIAQIFPPLEAEDGADKADLRAAERRLGFRLPAALRAYYELAYYRGDITETLDFLYHLDDLEVEDGMLSFYGENQQVTLWAIRRSDVAMDDPEVYTTPNDVPYDWQPTGDTVSVFLSGMTLWQAVMGGAAYSGTTESATAPAAAIAPILAWPKVDMGRFSAMEAYVQPGMVVCVSPPTDGGEIEIYAAAATEQGYHQIRELITVDWSWAERDDEDDEDDDE